MKNKLKTLLVVSPNYSIKMLEEEIRNLKEGDSDFSTSVDWRISAPLGILYIAAKLREYGYEVYIHDLHRAFYLCRQNGYFSQKNLSDFFEDHFASILKKRDFDVLGISCLFNVASTTVNEMGNICRSISPDTVIVTGGHYPTSMYREVLEQGTCDYVLLGEAEETFIWLLDNVDNTLFSDLVINNPHIADRTCNNRSNKVPAVIQDLDSIPMPAWDLLPNSEEYITESLHAGRVGSSASTAAIRSAGILTTRGCPMRCTFCAAHGVHGRKIRAHSIEYMMRHIDWLVERYDINHLLIEDDMFNFSSNRTIEFCRALLTKHPERFSIEFPNGLAVWNLDEEVVENLKKIGLQTVTIAIESGNQYVQKHILKKNLNLDVVRQKIDMLKRHDIGIRAFFIVGFIGETIEMMQDTVQFALDIDIDWAEIKVFTPLAGSEMYDIAEEKGYLVGDTSEHVYGRCRIKTPQFSPEQVEDLRYDANIRVNFLNNRNLKEGRYEIAEETFTNLLDVYPHHIFAQWGSWQALKGQGKEAETIQSLQRLHDLVENSKTAHVMLKRYDIQLPDID